MSLPSRVGRYAVRRRIGSGGFATVWLAYDEQLDAPVAVKVLAENWTEDHHVRTRFVEEGRYLRRVESPHVVTVYDAGELDDGRPYLVMTYADQGTLADRLEAGGLTVAQTLEVVRQVGAGLQALHDRGILHRDVKPANVLFRTVDADREGPNKGTIKAMVGDLGLGKALDGSSRLTMIAGTPSYVAPEQAQGETPDSRADQYSLGVLTYLLLAGRTPWSHSNLSAAADPQPPPPISTPEREFPAAVEDVVRRALSRDRDDRWPSVTAYVAALDAALGEQAQPTGPPETAWLQADPQRTQPGARPTMSPAVGPLPDPVPPRRSRRRLAGAVALCVVTLAGGAVGGWYAVHAVDATTRVTDDRDSLSVTVPDTWDDVRPQPWTPAGQDGAYPAVSAGTSSDWQTAPGGEGVFLGVLPLNRLPVRVPQHPGCRSEPPIHDTRDNATRTVYYTDCPGVVVERLVKVADNRVLWVQVRSESRATANSVLASVATDGI